MVPEVIAWEGVRYLSIEGATIRFVHDDIQEEIVFPSEAALQEALRRWTIDSGRATEFFRRHDFQNNQV